MVVSRNKATPIKTPKNHRPYNRTPKKVPPFMGIAMYDLGLAGLV